jgi:HlyD family secretion protein
MKRKRVVLIIVAAAVVIGLGVAQAVARMGGVESEQGRLEASGFIEAEEISIAPEVGGQVVELSVAEGDTVEAGQALVRLDDTLLQAQAEVERAGLEVAEATLALVRAGARPEAIRQAQATLAQAEATREGAYQAWQDMLALVENPQELDAQIALAEALVARTEADLLQASALRDAAAIGDDAYQDARHELGEIRESLEAIPEPLRPALPGVQLGFHLLPNAYWKAWVGVNTAGAAYDGARRALDLLYAMRREPQQLQAEADAAEAQYRAAEAAAEMARAALEGLQEGAIAEEIAAAEAEVQQAQARLESALVVLDKLTLTAPVGGQVLEVVSRVGELAAPGATLLNLADLGRVTLTVYVPENRLGQVRLGQQVEVRVDSFPDQVFTGEVATIASEAEFTPRNVQTQDERVNMVFAVKVIIPNPEHALKPGMPADAMILIQEQ